jgi:signal peptidase I
LRSNLIQWLGRLSLLFSLILPGLGLAVRGSRLYFVVPLIFVLALCLCRFIGWWPDSFYLPLLICYVAVILVDIILCQGIDGALVSKKLRVISVSILLASWVSLFFFKSLIFNIELFLIPSGSMEPTLQVGDVVVVETKGLSLTKGDIVVFNHDGLPESYYIKRIVGISGDEIKLQASYLFINQIMVRDRIKSSQIKTWKVKKEQFFVMGDNTNHSIDSRYFGPIEREQVVGVYLLTLSW